MLERTKEILKKKEKAGVGEGLDYLSIADLTLYWLAGHTRSQTP